jgi:hypothetical protein
MQYQYREVSQMRLQAMAMLHPFQLALTPVSNMLEQKLIGSHP